MDLRGKAVIVTGASRGIGRRLAVRLGEQGALVTIAARTVEPHRRLPGTIGETLSMVEGAGGRAIAVQADLGKRQDLGRVVDATLDAFGRIDVLVNNAADTKGVNAAVEEYPVDRWLEQFDVNVHAPFFLIGLVVPHLRAQGGGVIVNLTAGASEPLSFTPGVDAAPMGSLVGYGTTKAALNRMANALAPELARANIAIVNLDPGLTWTEYAEMMADRGLLTTPGLAHPMDTPVDAVLDVLMSEDPLTFAGKVIDVERKVRF
jgi:NAD(P)-dependent dehydrogenase (short-subunit alcohol dehydrogenase family)